MDSKKSLVAVLVIIVLSIIIIEQPWQATQEVRQTAIIGGKAPVFSLQNIGDETVSLSDYADKFVVLNFWASWCPPCREEMPAFQELYDAHQNELVVLGVNLQESKNNIIPFLEENNIEYPILLDPNETVKKTYNVITQPVTYFINKEGYIVDKKMGELTIEEINEKVSDLLEGEVNIQLADQDEVQTLADGTKYIIHPDRILSGGVPKDGIDSIDNPRFGKKDANWMDDEDLGVGVVHKGEARFYPFKILVTHEIVNDEIRGDPVLITYCPLCFTAVVFDRTIDEEGIEFGVSGKLFNSELVMYDRKTETYWSQTLGKGIIGPLAGRKLQKLRSDTVLWKDWKNVHPGTKVLHIDTGFARSYNGRNPYGKRDDFTDINLRFSVEHESNTLPAYDIVYGIEVDGVFKAYEKEALQKAGSVTDVINETEVVVSYDERLGSAKAIINGEEIVVETLFWFAWYAFHPETMLYR